MAGLLYQRVADQIIEYLILNKYSAGDQVLSVREAALKFNVNPKTVNRAYKYLEDLDIFATVKGEGRFIVDNGQKDISSYLQKVKIYDFCDTMIKQNCEEEFMVSTIRECYARTSKAE